MTSQPNKPDNGIIKLLRDFYGRHRNHNINNPMVQMRAPVDIYSLLDLAEQQRDYIVYLENYLQHVQAVNAGMEYPSGIESNGSTT